MLTIFVSRRKQRLIAAGGFEGCVCRAYVRQGENLEQLQKAKTFENLSSVRMVVLEWFRLKRLPRHPAIERGVICFLEKYQIEQDMEFDCYAFANLVHGIEPSSRAMQECWDARHYDRRIEVGNAVFLRKADKEGNHFRHAAIYIGRGLYISVYGAGGDLEVSTLRDMKKFYGANVVYIATPKAAP